MTEEQMALIEMVAEELGGKIHTTLVTDKYKEYREITIKYAEQKRQST